MSTARISYHGGTIEVRDLHDGSILPSWCAWDSRTHCFRAPASEYAPLIRRLVHAKIEYQDDARDYGELDCSIRVDRTARPFQGESLQAWLGAKGRGVVVLPTGAGKSHVAMMAIDAKKRDTLVVAPTLDLVHQWHDNLHDYFGLSVGVVGGGDHRLEPVTVTTYDSAYLHMEHLGNRFGLVVFDECHHLPGETYALAAQFCLAPFRLGLTATLERPDGRHALLDELIGPTVYRRDIIDLRGEYLAEYDVARIKVELSPEELEAYHEARNTYRSFIARHHIDMSATDGWSRFIILSARGEDGRRAMSAYQRQRRLSFAAPSKLEYLEQLLQRHRGDRTIVFTQDNATVYAISRRFLIPAITHQTKISERAEILTKFKEGSYRAIATSKVLNEGVDVPEANVAVVMSGSGSVREHVQRLGRILRQKSDGCRAQLYELVAGGTSEAYTSRRRRDHSAYR